MQQGREAIHRDYVQRRLIENVGEDGLRRGSFNKAVSKRRRFGRLAAPAGVLKMNLCRNDASRSAATTISVSQEVIG